MSATRIWQARQDLLDKLENLNREDRLSQQVKYLLDEIGWGKRK